MEQHVAENYIVEVTKRPEGAKSKQVEAVATTFNIPVHKAQQLLQRLPGVVTKPVPARLAHEIAERFEKAWMEALVRAHAAETVPTSVAKVAAPDAKLPEPDAFANAVDKMFTPDASSAEPDLETLASNLPAVDTPEPEQPTFAPNFDTSNSSDTNFDGSDFRTFEPQAVSQPSVAINPVRDDADFSRAYGEEATDEETTTDEGPVLSEVSARDAAKESYPEAVTEVSASGAAEKELLVEEEAIDLEALEGSDKKQSSQLLLPLFALLVVAIIAAWFFFI